MRNIEEAQGIEPDATPQANPIADATSQPSAPVATGPSEATGDDGDADLQPLGERIRKLLEERRLSQGDLALRTGIDRTELSRILNGKRPPNGFKLGRIAQALDTTVAALIEGALIPPATQWEAEQFAEVLRRLFAAEGERDEARALLRALEQRQAEERNRWNQERAALMQEASDARSERDRRILDAARNEQKLVALVRQLEGEKFSLSTQCQAREQQIAALQRAVSDAKGAQAAALILGGLGGLMIGGGGKR